MIYPFSLFKYQKKIAFFYSKGIPSHMRHSEIKIYYIISVISVLRGEDGIN